MSALDNPRRRALTLAGAILVAASGVLAQSIEWSSPPGQRPEPDAAPVSRVPRRHLRVVRPATELTCQGAQPPVVTDFEVLQSPALAEPPARMPFRDPVFGSCLLRVTDRVFDLAPEDGSGGLKNEYSRVQAFNSDGTRLLLRGTAATWYLYDAPTLRPLAQLPLDVDPRWSATDPDLVYHASGTQLRSYDVGSGQAAVVHDFAADLPGHDPVVVWTRYEGSPSRDGRWWGLMAQDQSWDASAFLVYDLTGNQVTATLDVRGWPAEARAIDSVTISPLGTYFLAYMDRYCAQGQLGTAANPCGLMVYDRSLQNGRGLLRIAGHSDTALDAGGREVLVYQDIDTDHIAMLDLASGAVTPLWPIDFSHTSVGLHLSGRAFDRPGWAVISTYDGDLASHTWMDDQVFLVELKANGRVVRLAHTRSLVDDSQEHDYWAEPQATANRDLSRILFTTNWGRSGTDQVETFLIQVPPEAFSAGAVYYVAPDGSDADPGTPARPWRTVGKAAATLQPGETVLIRAGTYHERVVAERSGTAGAPITYAAYPGETATIDGTGLDLLQWTGLFDLSGRDHITVKGLHVVNSTRAGILADTCGNIVIEDTTTTNTYSSGIDVWNSHDVVVAGNEVVQANNGGDQENLSILGTTRFEVRDNHVHDGGTTPAGGEGICVKDGSSHGKVYRNHVHHLPRLGIYVDGWDKYTHDIEVFANTVHDTENDGFTIASEMGGQVERVFLYNNVSYNNRFLGINVSQNGTSATHPMRDVFVVNNTVVGNGTGVWGGGIAVDSVQVEGVVVANNIVADNLSFQIVVGAGVPAAQVSVHHNLVDGFREYEDETRGTSFVEGDPRFASHAAFDFHLLAGSPALNAGDASALPAGAVTDRDGHPRVVGPAVDLGAYERQTVP